MVRSFIKLGPKPENLIIMPAIAIDRAWSNQWGKSACRIAIRESQSRRRDRRNKRAPPPKSAVLAAQLFVVYSILSRFLQGQGNLHYFCRGKANFIVWGAGSYSFKTGCWLGTILILFEHMPYVITYILGYPTGYSQHITPNKCGVLSVDIKTDFSVTEYR